MDYQLFLPHKDLAALVKCYWTLELQAEDNAAKQRIVPDGCIEMAFILGEDIKRYTSETEFILQPRAMVLGQTIEPFYIEPIGYVNTFAVRFYPHGFANFVKDSIHNLPNKETPISFIFGEETAQKLEKSIILANGTRERIEIIESFLCDQLSKDNVVDSIVKITIDALLATKGNSPIQTILKEDISKRRQLERKFRKQIGISPKQLGKVIRLQAALKTLLSGHCENLTHIAYENEYYDQAHFIRDFKEFTGTRPKEFLNDENMALSVLFYKNQ